MKTDKKKIDIYTLLAGVVTVLSVLVIITGSFAIAREAEGGGASSGASSDFSSSS